MQVPGPYIWEWGGIFGLIGDGETSKLVSFLKKTFALGLLIVQLERPRDHNLPPVKTM
jgi:hypothetical protein